MRFIKTTFFVTSLALMTTHLSAQSIQYPETRKDDSVEDNYFDRIIKDPYRWLENDTSAETAAWVKAQNRVTFDFLNKLPQKQFFTKRLTEVWNYEKKGIPEVAGNYMIYYKNDGLQNQSILYIKSILTGKEEVLIDPNQLSKDGTVAIQATAFSRNQKYFAYAVSAAGSDWQDIYIMEVAGKKLLKEKIEHVKFTNMEWIGDKGFYYSGYSRPKNEATKYSAKTEYQKIFFHTIGESQDKDKLVYEDRQHPLRYVGAQVTEDERYLILNIAEGTDGSEIKIKDLTVPNSAFVTLVEGFSTNARVVETLGNKIVIHSNLKAGNYQLYTTTFANGTFSQWEVLVKERYHKLAGATIFGDRIFCTYLENACSRLVIYNSKGEVLPSPMTDSKGYVTLSGFDGRKDARYTYFSQTGYTEPTSIWKYDLSSNKISLHFKPQVKFNSDDFITEQHTFPSSDGTAVKMFMVRKKNIPMDGNNPTMLYGYGGFNISLTPGFSPAIIPFLEEGGIYCVVNLRGGGEFGEGWHRDGMLERKQNVFNDFIGAAEFLISNKYTSSKKLAIRGGSNGGLLVGACMTQRPDLFRVAIPQVGVLDMLRYHKFTVGWGWAVEYGSSEQQDQFDYLLPYSPLHNVKKDVCYPATLITTADHDDRVVPAHSFKFAAELQDKQSCDNPVLIRIDVNAGHGAGKPTSKTIEENADIWAFMMYHVNQ